MYSGDHLEKQLIVEVTDCMYILLLAITFIGIYTSIRSLWDTSQTKSQFFSLENLITLFFIYVTVLIGFGIIYTMLEMKGYAILIEGGNELSGGFVDRLETSLYFSAITLLSVGYGDVTPIGLGRWVAVLEALLGYTIPAAIVVRTVIDIEKNDSL